MSKQYYLYDEDIKPAFERIQSFFQKECGGYFSFRDIIGNLCDEELANSIINWAINDLDFIKDCKNKSVKIKLK